jgi:hypothetical protein
MDDAKVPTREELWIVIQRFAETTQRSFTRLESKVDAMGAGVNLRLDRVENSLEGVELRLERVESRLTSIESWKVPMRLDDHEARITSLERRSG